VIITIDTEAGIRVLLIKHACETQNLCSESATLCRYEVRTEADPDAAKMVSVQCAPEKKRLRAILKAIELVGL